MIAARDKNFDIAFLSVDTAHYPLYNLLTLNGYIKHWKRSHKEGLQWPNSHHLG